jgi:Flp pilus assembly pilin Flp
MDGLKRFTNELRLALYGIRPEREEGQSNAEFALVLFFIAIACAAAFSFFGGKVRDTLDSVNAAF